MTPRLVVYTAIFGQSDNLPKELPAAWCSSDTQWVCFTDSREQAGRGWETWPAQFEIPNPRKRSRAHKCQPHLLFPGCDLTVWIDGSIHLLANPADWALNSLWDHQHNVLRDVATFKHSERQCVYEELQACLRLKKDVPEVMRKQVNSYRQAGYPVNSGLAETGVLVRRATPLCIQFNNAWWAEIEKGSLRDQLSFNYSAHRLGLKYKELPGSVYNCPYCVLQKHRRAQ